MIAYSGAYCSVSPPPCRGSGKLCMQDAPLTLAKVTVIGRSFLLVFLFPHGLPSPMKLSPIHNTLMSHIFLHLLLGALLRMGLLAEYKVPSGSGSILCFLRSIPSMWRCLHSVSDFFLPASPLQFPPLHISRIPLLWPVLVSCWVFLELGAFRYRRYSGKIHTLVCVMWIFYRFSVWVCEVCWVDIQTSILIPAFCTTGPMVLQFLFAFLGWSPVLFSILSMLPFLELVGLASLILIFFPLIPPSYSFLPSNRWHPSKVFIPDIYKRCRWRQSVCIRPRCSFGFIWKMSIRHSSFCLCQVGFTFLGI